MCHGSRLICDKDVLNKQFEVIQRLEFPEFDSTKPDGLALSLCSFDRNYLLVGTGCYFIHMLKWDAEIGKYNYVRRLRMEKSNNGEGAVTTLERVEHMQNWVVSCTLRTFRVFQLVESCYIWSAKKTTVVQGGISKMMLKMVQ
jgi:hypothetical protein